MILGLGLFIALGVLIHSLLRGKKAPANPWGASSLEWQAVSPPSLHNFDTDPVEVDPYDLDAQIYDPNLGGYRLREMPPIREIERKAAEPVGV